MGSCCIEGLTPKGDRIQMGEEKEKETEEEVIPEGDETGDIAGVMGVLTSVCQYIEPEKRKDCFAGIEPLHKGERKPLEVLEDHFLKFRDDEAMEKAEKRLLWLIDRAKKNAKRKVGEEGSPDLIP